MSARWQRACRAARAAPALQMLLLAAAYVLAAQAASLFRLEPGWVSPVWPAAGIAMAALVVGGLRLWPGVLAGHLLYSVDAAALGNGGLAGAAMTLLYPVGPLLQAVAGAWIVRHQRVGLALARDTRVLRTLLLAGPLACTIAATWGSVLALATGDLVPAGFASTWFLWWYGDTVGVLLFGPLVLAALPGGRCFWPGGNLRAVLPIVAAACILLPGVYWFHDAEEANVRQSLTLQAERAFDAMQQRLRLASASVEAVGHSIATNDAMDATEFGNLATRIAADGVVGVGWIPRVAGAEREAFVAAARDRGITDYAIREPGADGGLVVAGRRPEYFPVLYAEMPTADRRSLGMDVGAVPSRRAMIERARDSGRPVAGKPTGADGIAGRSAIVLLVPVYADDRNAQALSLAQRREYLRGFVGGLIDPSILGAAVGDMESLAFTITDASDAATPRQLVEVGSTGSGPGGVVGSRNLELHGRWLEATASLAGDYWQPAASAASRAFMLVALLGALLIAAQAVSSTVRDRMVSLKVLARSRELRNSRRRLSGARHVGQLAAFEIGLRDERMTLDNRTFEILGTTATAEGGHELPLAEALERFLHPDDRDAFRQVVATLSGGKRGHAEGEFRVVGSDGRIRHLLVYFDATAELGGDTTHVLCHAQDITRRKNTEIALRESEAYSRGIVESSSDLIMVLSLEGRLLDVNADRCDELGLRGFQEARGRDWRTIWRNDRDFEAACGAIDAATGGGTARFTASTTTTSGSTKWWDVVVTPIVGTPGEPHSLLCVTRDISEQYEAQEQVRRINADLEAEIVRRNADLVASERRYRELFDNNPMPMLIYDCKSLAITAVNEAAVRRYGFSRGEFLTRTVRDVLPPGQQAELDLVLRRRASGYSPPHETVHRAKDGTSIEVEVSTYDVVTGSRCARLMLANDVTARNRANRLLIGQKNILEEISAGAPLEKSLGMLAELARSDVAGRSASVHATDAQTGELRCIAAPGLPAAFATNTDSAAARGAGFFRALARSDEALLVPDAREHPLGADLAETGRGRIGSCWSTPVVGSDGAVLGAFVCYYGDSRKPTAEEVDALETIARTAALAITRDRESRKLEESREQYRTTFETAGLGICHTTPDGTFSRTNPAMSRIFGHDADELLAMRIDDLAHTDDRHVGADDRAAALAGKEQSFFIEKRHVRKDGQVIWCAITASPVRRRDGQVEYVVTVIEDITWRKAAEAELHRQQEINRLLLENLSEGVIACDANGKLMLFNKAARAWHGADLRDVEPDDWAAAPDVFEPDATTPMRYEDLPLIRALRGEQVRDSELCIMRPGHPPRTVLASGATLYDADGTKLGAVVVLHDVTVRRQSMRKLERAADKLRAANAAIGTERESLARRVAERTAELTAANEELASSKEAAEEASRAKSAFLAVMSHEIRTPMNGILGMVDVLNESSLSDDQLDAVATIRDSSSTLLRLIDDILDFSKVEAGRLELENAPVSLSAAVEAVCDSLTPTALDGDVDLHLYVDTRLPAQVIADETRLRQLLYNLVGNAIKFSAGHDGKRGDVRVSVERAQPAPLEVLFRVTDNGVGIDPTTLPGLFDSFTQAEVSTTRRFGGTGLGLAITQRLVELMGGRIDVTSEPGGGSEFVVRLPFAGTDDGQPEADLRLDDLQAVFVGEHADADALRIYLEDAGADVDVAASASRVSEPGGVVADPVVVVRRIPEAGRSDAELLAECSPREGCVDLLLTCGTRANARVIGPQVVVLQASAIHRRDFLKAVAIAAGRESPDAMRRDPGLRRGQLVAPSVTQARADGRLILVAEDDPINQKVILRQLKLLGYAGEVAANGAEALAMWRQGDYSLLLTDLHMPEMDGYDLARKIRAEEASDTRRPILALTANALRGEAERAAQAGCDAFMTKPMQLAALGEALGHWLPAIRDDGMADYLQSTATASGAVPSLDQDILRSIIGDDTLMMHEFLNEYLVAAESAVTDLRRALATGDDRRLAALAHRQKGAARSIGAVELGDRCAELENAARSGDQALAGDLIERLECQAQAVTDEIRELLRDRPAAAGGEAAGRGAP